VNGEGTAGPAPDEASTLDPFALWFRCQDCHLLTAGDAALAARKAVDHEESTGHTMTGGTSYAARRETPAPPRGDA
jgi:hypothetical protein